jgi:hypothetical protein
MGTSRRHLYSDRVVVRGCSPGTLPGSWWEQQRDDPDKQAAARERYGENRATPWLAWVSLGFIALPFVAGFVSVWSMGERRGYFLS